MKRGKDMEYKHWVSQSIQDRVVKETIPSQTLRNWISEHKHRLSVAELVSLINNSSEMLLNHKRTLMGVILEDLTADIKWVEEDTAIEESDREEYIRGISDDISNIEIILEEMQSALDMQYGDINKVLMFSILSLDNEEDKVAKSLNAIETIINKNGYRMENKYANVIDIYTSEIVQCILFNDRFEMTNCYNPNHCNAYANTYIDIPIEYKVGDIVVECKGSNNKSDKERFVVCASNILPEHLKQKSDYFDSCVTVIPENVLDMESNKSYVEQIDAILSKRIQSLDDGESEGGNNVTDVDIISMFHEHISIVNVEKA